MMCRSFVFVLLAAVFAAVSSPGARAHHGPPHDEIDEFDTAASRRSVPTAGVSWPVLIASMAGVAAALALSRKYGVDAEGSSRVAIRR
jgi:hypothetical protein